VFLDFRTDPTENVWPMVQAGKGITEMLLGAEETSRSTDKRSLERITVAKGPGLPPRCLKSAQGHA
jgi:hypothetical protein